MAAIHRRHVCSECGAAFVKWAGRCTACGEWNTLTEQDVPPPGAPAGGAGGERPGSALEWMISGGSTEPVALKDVDADGATPVPTGISEFDRVLSGGLVPGSVTLLGGEPGIGKSTLALQVLASMASQGHRSLVIAAEESASQVRSRAARLGELSGDCLVLTTNNVLSCVEAADRCQPEVLVVDSIQTIGDPAVGSPAGSPRQVRECAQLLAQYAKITGVAVVLVGHVTKDGSLAGPKTLEHLVDSVLSFEGDRHQALRALVSTKHRFGPAGEMGLFEMTDEGLRSLADPSALLLGDRRPDVAGSVVVPVVEGRRPILVEVQVLISPQPSASRRVVQGLQPARVSLVLAVLESFSRDMIGSRDGFVSTVGGIRVGEPAADLGIALAAVSSITQRPVAEGVVVFGEVGLSGDVRQVPRADKRLAEAARLGFRTAIVPLTTADGPPGISLQRVGTVAEAVLSLGLFAAERRALVGAIPPGPARLAEAS